MNETQLKQNQVEDLLIMETALKLYKSKLEKYNEQPFHEVCSDAEILIIKENLEVKHKITRRLLRETQTKINAL